MFAKPAQANRPNLRRRLAAAQEALLHAEMMCNQIIAEGDAGERRKDRRAMKAAGKIRNAYSWLIDAQRTFG
jgi:hypothetical protein